MLRTIRLFQFAGISVFLHWSWFLVAFYEIGSREGAYSSIVWNVLEYLAIFAIVTMHEFGHSLACRQVGGYADRIVLWPLGGVAIVDPPQRPGAMLWSIAAGPLVNVMLWPVLKVLLMLASNSGLAQSSPDVYHFLEAIKWINIVLLVFNLLPIYPLDGGQILRALLWFAIGRARSLMATAILGFVGVAGLALLAIASGFNRGSFWLIVIAGFGALRCISGFNQARSLNRMAKAQRREGFACPSCRARPPFGALWACSSCSTPVDIFENGLAPISSMTILDLSHSHPRAGAADEDNPATCPKCGVQFPVIRCADCGAESYREEWETTYRNLDKLQTSYTAVS
jgi:Zn-dependent protease